jgi:polar amino acid transport system substrate-binding protein
MKRFPRLLLLFALFWLIGCGKKETTITNLAELAGGKTVAVPTGTVADQFVLKRFPHAKIKYYNSALDCVLAVQGGKADAAAYDLPVLKNIVARNEGLSVLPELIVGDRYGFGFRKDDIALKQAVDGLLAEMKANGTYADMMKRWFPEKGSPAPMPDIPLTGRNGVLRLGTAAVTEPMSFVDARHKVVGFDVEFATRVAQKLGKQIEITDMEFGGLLPALISGKVDMIGAGLSITEERAKRILYSESYYPSGIAVVVRAGGEPAPSHTTAKMRDANDVRHKTLGVLLGSVYDTYASRTYPEAKVLQYQNLTDMLTALNSGKIDVTFMDQSSVPEMLKANPDLGILAKDIFSFPYGAGFNKETPALRDQFNAFLKEIRRNGIYADMVKRWMEEGRMEEPKIESSNKNGVLRAGVIDDAGMPFSLIKDGQLIGFDIELGSRFAASTGRAYQPVRLQFGSLIASLATHKIDIITASMFITDERKKMIDFSDPYDESGVSILARKDRIEGAAGAGTSSAVGQAGEKGLAPYASSTAGSAHKNFFKRVADSFYSNIILEKRYLLILDGLKLTILITVFAALLGTILGGVVCYMRMSRNAYLSRTAAAYISLLRGTPVLVLLMIIYYVVFASVNINPALVAVIAFGLNFAAYVSEMFRTSIQSVDKGQWEAGIAGGFTKPQTFVYIVSPQALRQLLPVYKGEFISLMKMTSVVGYIAVQDLTKVSDIIRSRTFDAFFPLIMAAVIYLLLAWLLTWALGAVEVSVDPKRRTIKPLPEADR